MPYSNRDLRAAGAALLLSCFAAGCAQMAGDARSIYNITGQVISPHKVTLAEAASSPHASLGLRVGGSAQLMIILATNVGSEQLWISSAHIGITTSNGRVVRTAGLDHDLGGLVSQGRAITKQGVTTTRWLADFPEMRAYSVPVSCESRPTSDETIEILGAAIKTRRVEEHCSAESVKFIWTFDNTYWVDPANGFVWRSVQHVNPKLDALELEVFRPPA